MAFGPTTINGARPIAGQTIALWLISLQQLVLHQLMEHNPLLGFKACNDQLSVSHCLADHGSVAVGLHQFLELDPLLGRS